MFEFSTIDAGDILVVAVASQYVENRVLWINKFGSHQVTPVAQWTGD